MVMDDTIDEALELLAERGPIYGGFLANHGPMAAEALVQLGRDDAVLPFLDWYGRQLEDRPRLNGRIEGRNWRELLGRREEFAAWQRFFEAELAGRPWRDVLETWSDRLAPGLWAELLHGLIRTGHAARSLAARETPLRLRELAQAGAVGIVVRGAARSTRRRRGLPCARSLCPAAAVAAAAARPARGDGRPRALAGAASPARRR